MNKIKITLISIFTLIIICLFGYGIYNILNIKNNDQSININSNIKYTLSSTQLDKLEQPTVKEKITFDTLPNTNDTLTEIDLKTLKKLFQTSKKSILVVEQDYCSYCLEYEPRLINILKEYKINAYKINLTTFKDSSKLNNYIYYQGTPTTFIIQNSKVLHTISGTMDDNTIRAFLNYFYFRNN